MPNWTYGVGFFALRDEGQIVSIIIRQQPTMREELKDNNYNISLDKILVLMEKDAPKTIRSRGGISLKIFDIIANLILTRQHGKFSIYIIIHQMGDNLSY